MGIIRKGSNPELFFKLTNGGRQYKKKIFEINPGAITGMETIIKNNPNPNKWRNLIKNKYGIIVDQYFWQNNPMEYIPPPPSKNLVTEMFSGGSLDVHKWIGKLPKPKAGWTPGKYKYMDLIILSINN